MDNLIELLAEDSHIGWMQEKQRQGYADHVWPEGEVRHTVDRIDWQGGFGLPHLAPWCGTEECYLPKDKHHPDMLPYAELPDHVKEYDRVTVRGVLAGIECHGYKIVKAEAS